MCFTVLTTNAVKIAFVELRKKSARDCADGKSCGIMAGIVRYSMIQAPRPAGPTMWNGSSGTVPQCGAVPFHKREIFKSANSIFAACNQFDRNTSKRMSIY